MIQPDAEKLDPKCLVRPMNTKVPELKVPELITLAELSTRWQISAKKLRRACGNRHSDPLPCIRIGHEIRFNMNDARLAEWLERRVQRGIER